RDDLRLVYELLQHWHVRSLGQLEKILGEKQGHRVVRDEASRARILARCKAARAWVAAWRRGRGRQVDRTVLEGSGIVSDTFLDKVSAEAERLEGDALGLLEALKERAVSRFGDKKIDELEAWLQTEGYISTEAQLDRDGRLQAALLEATSEMEPPEVSELVSWLEAGIQAAGNRAA
ncbi:MAG: hypothetical protein ACOCVR_03040, partial [Myxococcota bacterium]